MEQVADARVAALLRELAELRLSATTHLALAAAAMDADRPDIATELIEAQQRDVSRLRALAEELLHVDGAEAEQARRSVASAAVAEETELLGSVRAGHRPARRPAAPVAVLPARHGESTTRPRWTATGALLAAAAAAVVALMPPLSPAQHGGSGPTDISAVVASLDSEVQRSLDRLEVVARPDAPRAEVDEARRVLHAQLGELVPLAATDPVAALRVVEVLRTERALLAEHAPAALRSFEAQAVALLTDLRARATDAVRAALPPVTEFLSVSEQAFDALPIPADEPVPAPRPAADEDGGGAEAASAGRTVDDVGQSAGDGSNGSDGGTEAPAVPEPVVRLPELPVDLPTTVPLPDLPQPDEAADPAEQDAAEPSAPAEQEPAPKQPQLPAPLVLDLPVG